MVKINYPDGATPLDDYSALIPHWVQNRGDLNRVEAENISQAQKKYLQKKIAPPAHWFNVTELKVIHKAMFCDVWGWAGDFRTSVTSIGIKPYLISTQMGELCHEVVSWSSDTIDLTFLEQAARIHHRLVFIHPFENGNGRFSRLIADRYLIAYGCQYPQWPYLQDNGESRNAYIQSLKEADKGDYNPLINLMRKLGARDPYLSELLAFPKYKKLFSVKQLEIMVSALLRLGYDVNETKNNGHHPLQIAIQMNYQDIAYVLIKHGANTNFRDKSGYDAFEMAINHGLFKVAKAILNAGYPYIPRTPTSLKIKAEMLYRFDMEFF